MQVYKALSRGQRTQIILLCTLKPARSKLLTHMGSKLFLNTNFRHIYIAISALNPFHSRYPTYCTSGTTHDIVPQNTKGKSDRASAKKKALKIKLQKYYAWEDIQSCNFVFVYHSVTWYSTNMLSNIFNIFDNKKNKNKNKWMPLRQRRARPAKIRVFKTLEVTIKFLIFRQVLA